jgi:hypothetical protein
VKGKDWYQLFSECANRAFPRGPGCKSGLVVITGDAVHNMLNMGKELVLLTFNSATLFHR